MVVTIGQRTESLSVGVGADHLLVCHHPGRGVVHLGEGEAHGSVGTPNSRLSLCLSLVLAVFASDSSVCALLLLLCKKKESLWGQLTLTSHLLPFYFLLPAALRMFAKQL